jgi:WD40 repeat protein
MKFQNPFVNSEKSNLEQNDIKFCFGRDNEMRSIRQSLSLYPLTVLCGAQGSGKSSLLFAGIAAGLEAYYADTGKNETDRILLILVACDELLLEILLRNEKLSSDSLKELLYTKIYEQARCKQPPLSSQCSFAEVLEKIQEPHKGGQGETINISQIWFILDDVDQLVELGKVAEPLLDDIFESILDQNSKTAFLFSLSNQNTDRFEELLVSASEKFKNTLSNQWTYISLGRMNEKAAKEVVSESLATALNQPVDTALSRLDMQDAIQPILSLCKTKENEGYSPLYLQAILSELLDQLEQLNRNKKPNEAPKTLLDIVNQDGLNGNRILLAALLRAIQKAIQKRLDDGEGDGIDLYEVIHVLSRIITVNPKAAGHAELPIEAKEITACCREFGAILDLNFFKPSQNRVEKILDLLVDIKVLRLTLAINEDVFLLSKKYTLKSADLLSIFQELQPFYASFLSTLFKLKRLPLHAALERSKHQYDLACLLLDKAQNFDEKYQLGLRSIINEVGRGLLAEYRDIDKWRWNVVTGIFSDKDHSFYSKSVVAFKEPEHNISSLLFCESNQLILCGTVRGQILIYDLNSNTDGNSPRHFFIEYATKEKQRVTAFFVLKAESSQYCSSLTFLTASQDGRIKRWNLQQKLDLTNNQGWTWSDDYPKDRNHQGDMFPDNTDPGNDPFTSLCGCPACKIVVAGGQSGDLYLLDFRGNTVEKCKNELARIDYQKKLGINTGADSTAKAAAKCLAWLGCEHSGQQAGNKIQIVVGQQDGAIVRVEYDKATQNHKSELLFQCPSGFPIQAITYKEITNHTKSKILAVAAGEEPNPPILIIWHDINGQPSKILSSDRLAKSVVDDLMRLNKDRVGLHEDVVDKTILGDIERINTLALDQNGHLFIGSEDQKIRRIAIGKGDGNKPSKDGKLSIFESNYFGISQLALSSDGTRLISSGWNGTTSVWKLDDNKHQANGATSHQRNLSSLAVFRDSSSNQALLVSGSWDGGIYQWSIRSSAHSDFTSTHLLRPGQSTNQPNQPYEYKGQLEPDRQRRVWNLCYSSSGSHIASTGSIEKLGIRVWNAREEADKNQYVCQDLDPGQAPAMADGDEIRSIRFNATDRIFACGLWNERATKECFPRILLHQFDTHTLKSTLFGWVSTSSIITSLCFHPKNDLLFAATDGSSVILLSVKEVSKSLSGIVLNEDPEGNRITASQLKQSSTYVKQSSTYANLLLESQSGDEKRIGFDCIDVFLVDEKTNQVRVALGGKDKDSLVRVWQFKIKLGSDGSISIADSSVFCRLAGHEYWISAVAFSPNGQKLATSSFDGTVRIWDLSTIQAGNNAENQGEPLVLREHKESVTCVQFVNDDLLVTGGYDSNIILWNLSLDKITKKLKNRIPRNLTEKEWEVYIGSQYLKNQEDLGPYMRFQYPSEYKGLRIDQEKDNSE